MRDLACTVYQYQYTAYSLTAYFLLSFPIFQYHPFTVSENFRSSCLFLKCSWGHRDAHHIPLCRDVREVRPPGSVPSRQTHGDPATTRSQIIFHRPFVTRLTWRGKSKSSRINILDYAASQTTYLLCIKDLLRKSKPKNLKIRCWAVVNFVI